MKLLFLHIATNPCVNPLGDNSISNSIAINQRVFFINDNNISSFPEHNEKDNNNTIDIDVVFYS